MCAHSKLLCHTLTQVAAITTEIPLSQPSPYRGSPNTDKPDICLRRFIMPVLCTVTWVESCKTWPLEVAFAVHSVPLRYTQAVGRSTVDAWFSFFVKWASFCRVVLGLQSNWAKGTDFCLLTCTAPLTISTLCLNGRLLAASVPTLSYLATQVHILHSS